MLAPLKQTREIERERANTKSSLFRIVHLLSYSFSFNSTKKMSTTTTTINVDELFNDYGLSPLSPLSDSLSSIDSCNSNGDDFFNLKDSMPFDFNLDYKYDNYDHMNERPIKRVKIGIATTEMSTQTQDAEDLEDDDNDKDIPPVNLEQDLKQTAKGPILLANLCYFYHKYNIDCRHFADLYSAGVLISKRLKERKYEQTPKHRLGMSELLFRVYRDYKTHKEAKWIEFMIRKLREMCNDKNNKRKDILPFIHSFVFVHLSGTGLGISSSS